MNHKKKNREESIVFHVKHLPHGTQKIWLVGFAKMYHVKHF